MSRAWALLALVGCADPVLDPVQDALEAYDAGRAALASGDAVAARAAFAEARSHQPDVPTLAAWEAWAVAEGGDVPAALALLDAALARWPSDPDLRYNRAALRVRSGDAVGGADDLKVLLQAGAVHPRDAAQDPDFAALADDPQTAHLVPPPTLSVAVEAEEGAVLLGETWTLELTVRHPAAYPLALVPDAAAAPPLRLAQVVEEHKGDDGRDAIRRLRVEWRAVQAGAATAGPWALTAGPASGAVPPQPVEVVALPNRPTAAPDPPGQPLPLPSALGSADPQPTLARVDGWTVVTAPAEARIRWSWEGAVPSVVRLELRAEERTVLQRQVARAHPAGRVTVTRAGLTLLDAAVAAAP